MKPAICSNCTGTGYVCRRCGRSDTAEVAARDIRCNGGQEHDWVPCVECGGGSDRAGDAE
jgi:hypothetical protein